MRLWAEDKRLGTFELLMTLPVTMGQAVLGKFLAAWCFVGVALALTFPIWLTVNYLGDPDNGVIVAAYVGSLLMAGAFLAIGSCISAANKNQVVAFIISVAICFIFLLSGFPLVLDFFSGWAPQSIVDAISRPAEGKPWHEYRPIFLTDKRIKGGVEFWRENEELIAQASEKFGVDPEFIVAIPTFVFAILTKSLGGTVIVGMVLFALAEKFL